MLNAYRASRGFVTTRWRRQSGCTTDPVAQRRHVKARHGSRVKERTERVPQGTAQKLGTQARSALALQTLEPSHVTPTTPLQSPHARIRRKARRVGTL